MLGLPLSLISKEPPVRRVGVWGLEPSVRREGQRERVELWEGFVRDGEACLERQRAAAVCEGRDARIRGTF